MLHKFGFGLLAVLLLLSTLDAAEDPQRPTKDDVQPASNSLTRSSTTKKQLFTGRVVMLREALKKRNISAFEEYKHLVALETDDGELIPIVPDWRGRAFFQDKRLRNRKVELIGFRRPGIPFLQVITVFTFDKQGVRQYTDYWCDICSIPMYEIKPCDCCQDEIRLRFQPQELPADLRTPIGIGKADRKQSTQKETPNTEKKAPQN